MVIVKTSDTEGEAAGRVVSESFEGVDVVPTEFATQQEEVVCKMLNSGDYFSNASVSFDLCREYEKIDFTIAHE